MSVEQPLGPDEAMFIEPTFANDPNREVVEKGYEQLIVDCELDPESLAERIDALKEKAKQPMFVNGVRQADVVGASVTLFRLKKKQTDQENAKPTYLAPTG